MFEKKILKANKFCIFRPTYLSSDFLRKKTNQKLKNLFNIYNCIMVLKRSVYLFTEKDIYDRMPISVFTFRVP